MAEDFVWRDPEAARQAIAAMQLKAALAEDQSRENIAKDNAAAQRYATQSQMAQRDREFNTDAAIRREEIAARSGVRADAASRERGNIQYSTLRDSINVVDPPTKAELEAAMAGTQLTDDLKNDLRATRERAYKAAAANAQAGERAANGYTSELAALAKEKVPGQNAKARDAVLKRLRADKDVIFDPATGAVTSRHRMPREDRDLSGLMPPGSGVRKITDIQKQVGGVPAEIPEMPPTASVIAKPGELYGPPNTPTLPDTAPSRSAMLAGPRVVRASDIAAPPTFAAGELYGPPDRAAAPLVHEEYDSLPGIGVRRFATPTMGDMMRMDQSPEITPFMDMSEPYRAPVAPAPALEFQGPPNNAQIFRGLPRVSLSKADTLIQAIQHPGFARLAPADQRAILDELDMEQRMPRLSDLQTLRPQYVPVDENYYAPQ